MNALLRTAFSAAALTFIAGALPPFAMAEDAMEGAPKMTVTLDDNQNYPGGTAVKFEFVSNFPKDVFVDVECTGTTEDKKYNFGPSKPFSAWLVDAGRTVSKSLVIEFKDAQVFWAANPGTDLPVAAQFECKMIKVEVMG